MALNVAETIQNMFRKNELFHRIGNSFANREKQEVNDISSLDNFFMKEKPKKKRRESFATSKEDVGRATWTFLHTLAAQYPDKPSFQQKRDAKQLIDILTRMYPCGECAEHFTQVVRAHPPVVSSREEFSQWMCRVHNVVNRSIGKPEFNCRYISSRWQGVDCDTPSGCKLI